LENSKKQVAHPFYFTPNKDFLNYYHRIT